MPGKRPRIRCSGAYASTSGYLDATSVTRHKTHALIRGNENAWTEVDAEASLARFPASRPSGTLRSRPRPDIPASAAAIRPTSQTAVVACIENWPIRTITLTDGLDLAFVSPDGAKKKSHPCAAHPQPAHGTGP